MDLEEVKAKEKEKEILSLKERKKGFSKVIEKVVLVLVTEKLK